jgi:hypothetical protein
MSPTEKKKRANVVFAETEGYLPTVLNFFQNPKGEFWVYAEAYHRAAKHLLQGIVTHDLPYILDACPVVFLYRHALELHIKHMILRGNRLLRLQGNPPASGNEILSEHRLTALLVPVEKILDCMEWWKESEFEHENIKSFADCKTIIESVNEIDARSYAFRYPVDTEGSASVDERFSFDVHRFAALVDPVIEILSTAGFALDFEYDRLSDAIAERQQRALEEFLRS